MEKNTPILPPHKYSVLIKFFTIALLLVVIYSLILFPRYFLASRKFKQGSSAYNNRDYPNAIRYFEYVLQTVPTSKKAKIAIAKAYFANNDWEDDEKGLLYLQGITIDKDAWTDLFSVMPVEYRKYFREEK